MDSYAPSWPVKGGKQAVTCALHHDASVVFDGPRCGRVMLFKQGAPRSITDCTSTSRGIHDVGEEHRHGDSIDVDAARGGRAGDEFGVRLEDRNTCPGLAANFEIARDLG